MSLFKRLFGSSPAAPTEHDTVEYEGHRIIPTPMPEGKVFRLAARIEKDVDGEVKVHELIRADTLDSEEAAVSTAIAKAKQVIDEQGRWLFD